MITKHMILGSAKIKPKGWMLNPSFERANGIMNPKMAKAAANIIGNRVFQKVREASLQDNSG